MNKNAKNIKVLFFGSSNLCLPLLESLYRNFTLVGIVTRPDKPVGRKKILTPSPPKTFALETKTALFTPSVKKELLMHTTKLKALKSDIAVVADYGMIIPESIFTIPKNATINIHFSRLPHLRGASPVQFSLILGEKEAWITVILMDEKMDTGDIITSYKAFDIGNETAKELYERLFADIAKRIIQIIPKYLNGRINTVKQSRNKITYTKIFNKDDGFIHSEVLKTVLAGNLPDIKYLLESPIHVFLSSNFPDYAKWAAQNPALFIYRLYKALSPWPGVWTKIKDKTMDKRLNLTELKLKNSRIEITKAVLEGKKEDFWQNLKNIITL